MKVRDAMQRHVTVVHEQDSLELAQQLMRWSDLRELPVVDARERVVGVISERDLLRAVTEHADAPTALARPVHDFMSALIEHIRPDADLATAAAYMSRERLECLPVTEHDVLVGLLSVSNALGMLAQSPVTPIHEPAGMPQVSAIMQPEPNRSAATRHVDRDRGEDG